MKCSKCASEIEGKYWAKGKSKLCYNCGLKMKQNRCAYDWVLKIVREKQSEKEGEK